MTRVYFGLTSREGDRLGHLVRGVQMLRSYGNEARVVRYSDVVDTVGTLDAPPMLCCVLECSSDAAEEHLQGICRETEWSLGDAKDTLAVSVLQFGGTAPGGMSEPFASLAEGKLPTGMTTMVTSAEFVQLCDWGQKIGGRDADVAGEWPSATGR